MKDTIKGNYGKCHIVDCSFLLSIIEEDHFDLCITDPPYSVDAKWDNQSKKSKSMGNKAMLDRKKKNYNDNMSWEKKVTIMEECFRIAKTTIFTCGLAEFTKWIKYKEPTDILYWYKPNSFSKTSHFFKVTIEPILIYGELSNTFPFVSNHIHVNIDHQESKNNPYIHPHPKEPELYKKIIERLKPKTVLDPFIGSGTTGEVCEELGIKWVGLEKESKYKPDIERRINNGINKKRLRNLKNKKLLEI